LTPAYVLHRWSYRETSLIVEAFSLSHGRVPLVARGARREGTAARGLLQPFRPLLVSWSGRRELATLTAVEGAGPPRLSGRGLLSGFYLNELLMRLLPRGDPHPDLYRAYESAFRGLASRETEEGALRRFEHTLLEGLGYGVGLEVRDGDGAEIEGDRAYRYRAETGVVPDDGGEGVAVRGATLLALARGKPLDGTLASDAKRLMRYVLHYYLGDRPLGSRLLFERPRAPGQGGGRARLQSNAAGGEQGDD
jgi:DNA repair protein RecO (recombination protein O)